MGIGGSTLPRLHQEHNGTAFGTSCSVGGSSFSGTLPEALRNLSQALGQLADVLGRETASDPGLSSLLAELIPPTLTHRNGHREVV